MAQSSHHSTPFERSRSQPVNVPLYTFGIQLRPTGSGQVLLWLIEEEDFLAIGKGYIARDVSDVMSAATVHQRYQLDGIGNAIEGQRQVVIAAATQHPNRQLTRIVLVLSHVDGNTVVADATIKTQARPA